MLVERPDDEPRGPADVLERAALAQELRRDEETLGCDPGPTREARRRSDRQGAPDHAGGPCRHGRGRLVEGPRDVRDIGVARVVDRGPDADDDEVQPVSGDLRAGQYPPGGMLDRERLGQPRLVERDPPTDQRRQTVGVLFDEHHVSALLREAHRRRDPDVPGADDGRLQPALCHDARVTDPERGRGRGSSAPTSTEAGMAGYFPVRRMTAGTVRRRILASSRSDQRSM